MSNGPDPTLPTGDEFTAKPPAPKAAPSSSRPLSAEDLITLNEEIASMARAGLPLDQGLAVLAREMGRGRLQQVTEQLAADLRAGHTLPEALKRQEGRVPSYYAALLAVGVRSGKLGDVLTTLTLYARSMADFRAGIVSALLYPAVVLLLGIGLIVFVGSWILPTYVKVYADFKMKLPLLTEVLVFIGQHSIELLVVPSIVFVIALATERWWLRSTAAGRRLWTRFVYSLPVVGTVVRSARLSAFAELLGILIDRSIPLPEALRLAGETSSDPFLNDAIKQVEKDLAQGTALGPALKQQRVVPNLVVWMIGFGERQGTLGPSLRQVAQMYRRQADVRAAFLRTILPPLLIIVLAGTLGFLFIFGLMAPMFELLDGLSGGGKK